VFLVRDDCSFVPLAATPLPLFVPLTLLAGFIVLEAPACILLARRVRTRSGARNGETWAGRADEEATIE
jgi:hypothetical protein